jgi:hypothetical protein
METWEFFVVMVIIIAVVGYFLFFYNPPSKQPELKSTGMVCANNTECLSGNCSNSICAQSNLYGACRIDSDCTEGICNYGFCSKSEIEGRCNRNNDCKEGGCLNNRCMEWSKYFMCFTIVNLKPYHILFWVFLFIGIILLLLGIGGRSRLSHGEWGFEGPSGLILIIISIALIYLSIIC